MGSENSNSESENDTMALIVGLTISTVILLGIGVYTGYSQFLVQSGSPGMRDLAVIVATLLGGTVLGARVWMLLFRS